jgi:hypothetical protein
MSCGIPAARRENIWLLRQATVDGACIIPANRVVFLTAAQIRMACDGVERKAQSHDGVSVPVDAVASRHNQLHKHIRAERRKKSFFVTNDNKPNAALCGEASFQFSAYERS